MTRFTSSNGSLSDSGISDGGTTSDGGLSERERRLGVLRRLAKQLETALAPGSEAMKSIAARMESAEAELKSLQNTCRDLIVRTATSHQQSSATKINDDKEIELSTSLCSDGEVTIINNGSLNYSCDNGNNNVIKNNQSRDGSSDFVRDNNSSKTLLSSDRLNQQHQLIESYSQEKNYTILSEKSGSLLQRQKNHKSKQRNKTTSNNNGNGDSSHNNKDESNSNDDNNGHCYRSQNNRNNGNDSDYEDESDDDDENGNRRSNNTCLELLSNNAVENNERNLKSRGQRRNRGRVWRVARIAVFMQLALITAFCIAYIMQPDCCENMNTYAMSFTPQLRYVRGPPPT